MIERQGKQRDGTYETHGTYVSANHIGPMSPIGPIRSSRFRPAKAS
jgi:hypothetical protein